MRLKVLAADTVRAPVMKLLIRDKAVSQIPNESYMQPCDENVVANSVECRG